MVKRVKQIVFSKVGKNATWLVVSKILQMFFSFLIAILTARYLGPANYGSLTYVVSFASLFTSICTLGLNNILVKEFVSQKHKNGAIIGTTLVLRFLSSTLSYIMLIILTGILNKWDTSLVIISLLYGSSLLFQIFDTFEYFFQSRLESKVVAISSLIAYLITTAYKVLLLILGKSIYWFAVANVLDYLLIAVLLVFAYYRNKGKSKLSFSRETAKYLFANSFEFILSGIMIAIYTQTDKLIVKLLLNSQELGLYSVASTLANSWVFILSALIVSVTPSLYKAYEMDTKLFDKRMRQLYAFIFYFSLTFALIIAFFPSFIINTLYGYDYLGASPTLSVFAFVPIFAYFGTARNIFIVCEKKQKYLKYIFLVGALLNTVLDFLLIPYIGIIGAALATLIAQIFTAIIIPLFMTPIRKNSINIIKGIVFKWHDGAKKDFNNH